MITTHIHTKQKHYMSLPICNLSTTNLYIKAQKVIRKMTYDEILKRITENYEINKNRSWFRKKKH